MRLAIWTTLALAALSLPAAAACEPAPAPVISLSYGSRYSDDSGSRTEIDTKGDAEADDALRPIDEFLRELTTKANGVFEEGADKVAIADCVVDRIAAWAAAGALGDLQSDTANLTIGARLAGFGLVLMQVVPHTRHTDAADQATGWLAGLMQTQMRFWEDRAPNGARQGNLRAWAALAGSATASLRDDPVMRGWSAWSIQYVLCSAAPDGSLPQEMTRGKYALKYQLHALSPLVVATLLLDRQGIPLQSTCDAALRRIVDFAAADVTGGAQTQAITGEVQTFFDGTDTLEGFHLAWIEAYLILDPDAAKGPLGKLAKNYRPLNYSKLGGKQALIWQEK